MKKRTLFLGALGAAVFALTADAQNFNPVPLTPGSFTQDIIVETNYMIATGVFPGGTANNYGLTATVGGGTGLGDNTFYERGLRFGQFNGLPTNGATFTHLSKPGIQYVMPPDYKANNVMMIDSSITGGTLTLVSATTATNISFLGTGGGGSSTVNYTVNHADASTDTGTITFVDWFNGASYAWTNSGRITVNGTYNNTGDSAGNPRVYSSEISVSGASPVVSIDFTYNTGQHANIFAVSGSASGGTWTPMPVTGFNQKVIVPATPFPLPLNATMDQGTNLAFNGNLATWFEKEVAGPSFPNAGLPHPGQMLTNVNFPTHVFQMPASYTANNAVLIDTNHQTANITPASPASYSAFALLTAGGNIGGANVMTNVIIMQHADGVNETNLFFGYDWFATNAQIAYVTGGRINMASRSLNSLAEPVSLVNNPKLFESTFGLANTTSPVTNIVLQFKTSPGTSSTTYVLAVSATAGAVAPVISGQTPFVNAYAGGSASFQVTLSAGSSPLTYIWQTNDVTLVNGGKVSGATTTNLVLTGVDGTDANFYTVIITNSAGAATSAPILLTLISTNTDITQPSDPITSFGGNVPANEAVVNAISNTTSKYLNFGVNDGTPPFAGPVGFTVTPLAGGSVVTGLRLYTANDAAERDPSDYMVEGSTDGTNFTVISSGSLTMPSRRNAAGQPINPLTQSLAEVDFANTTTNALYRITFSSVRDAANANSMQIGEVELLGTLAGTGPFLVQDTAPSFSLNFEGLTSTLSVTAAGTAPLTYQWKQNGVTVSGATNAAFAFATLPGTNTYNCIVANGFTPPATSSVATVVGVPSTLATTFVVNFHDAMGAQYAATIADGNANLWTNVVYSGMGAYPDLAANTNWNGFGQPNGYDPVFNATVSPQRASDGSPIPVTLSTTYSFDSGNLFFYGDGSTNNTCPTCPSYVLGLNAVAANGIPPGAFTLRNVPPGSYTLYIYCANSLNDRGSLFTINGSRQASCTNANDGAPAAAFIQDKTYVLFTNITPNADGTITGSYTGINNPFSGNSGEGNFNGLQLIKVATTLPVLSITPSGANVQISWTPGVGVLQSAPAVTGPYTDIPTATSPYSTPSAGAPQYYRIRL